MKNSIKKYYKNVQIVTKIYNNVSKYTKILKIYIICQV